MCTAGRLINARKTSSQKRPAPLNARPSDERAPASLLEVVDSRKNRNKPEKAMRKYSTAPRMRHSYARLVFISSE